MDNKYSVFMSEMQSTNYTKITWKFSSMQLTQTQKGKGRAGEMTQQGIKCSCTRMSTGILILQTHIKVVKIGRQGNHWNSQNWGGRQKSPGLSG